MPRRHPNYETHRPQPVARRHFFKRLVGALAGGLVLGTAGAAQAATQQPNATQGIQPFFIGQILMFGGTFAPRGWLLCDGTLYDPNTFASLYSIIGNFYGGTTPTSFAVPDFRSRVPKGFGTGTGLSTYALGDTGGEESHLLTSTEMPAHNHQSRASDSVGSSNDPEDLVNAVNPSGTPHYGLPAGNLMNNAAIGNTGGGQAHNVMQPYLAVNFIIAVDGLFPSRP